MIKVLHNNTCSKSRAILEYLDENNVSFEIIDILDDPLSENEIRTLVKKLGTDVTDIVRKTDPLYQELNSKNLSDDGWIHELSQNPSLIQRPILIKGAVAMMGRPVENVKFFLD